MLERSFIFLHCENLSLSDKKYYYCLLKFLSSSKLARQDSSIPKYLGFVLFRQKGNGLISRRVLLTHISTLLTDLNDVRRSVCLDLDTKPNLSTNNVCWNHLRNLTKT